MYVRALRSILSELNRQNRLLVVSDFQVSSPKTKDFLSKMKELELGNALIILKELDVNEYLGSRNLKNFEITDIDSVNPVELLSFDNIVVTVEALKQIEEKLQ